MHQKCVSDFCIESYIPFSLPSLSFPRHSVDIDLIRKDSSKILFGYNYACVFIKFGNLIIMPVMSFTLLLTIWLNI